MTVYREDSQAFVQIDGHVPAVLEKLGAEVAADAQRFAAVDTGLLRSRIHAEPPEKTPAGWSVKVVADVEYSTFVEYGTSKMRARPFLRPALWKQRGA